MKRSLLFIILALLAIISGYLISKVNWIGRLGINLFYDEYKIFKSWPKSTALIGGIYLVLYIVHSIIYKLASKSRSNLFNIICILLAAGGIYYTYYDFRNDFSHHVAGERFHLGFYLSWAGWIVLGLYFLTVKRKGITASDNMAAATV